jgi:hypothetical protein
MLPKTKCKYVWSVRGGGATTTTAGLPSFFFGFKIECSRDLPRSIVFHSFTPVLHRFAHFHDVCFYLTIYRVILSLGGGNSVT